MTAKLHISKRWFVGIVFGILIFFRASAFAADVNSLVSGKFNANVRSVRVEIARDLLGRIELLDSYLPGAKPSELSWIEKERAAIDKLREGSDAWSERMLQLYKSPEFQNQKLKTFLNNIRKSLECIINDKVKLNSEILCWAVVNHNLPDKTTFNDSITILRDQGRLPKDIAEKAHLVEANGFDTRFTFNARGIQEFIIIPYLAGHIK